MLDDDKSALVRQVIANEAIFHNAHDGIICIDRHSRIVFVNRAICAMFGYADGAALMGQPVEILMNDHQAAHHGSYVRRHLAGEPVPIMNRLRRLRARHADGHLFPVDIHVAQVRIEDEPFYVAFMRDMSDVVAQEQEVHRLLYYDSLTGLPNLRSAEQYLDGYFQAGQQDSLLMAVLDIDHMRLIISTFGFEIADGVFKAVGVRLREALRDAPFFGRLTGDQYTALFEGVDPAAAHETAAAVHGRISEALSYPVDAGTARVTVSVTAGFVTVPDLAATTSLALKHGDMALAEAKRRNRGGFLLLTADKLSELSENATLAHQMRDALQMHEFFVVIQPKIDLKTGMCTAGECLIRWRRQDGSFVPPDRFIPIAEQADLISNIGQFVYREACGFLRQWRRNGNCAGCKLAVNLSPKQLEQPGFVDAALEALALLEVPASSLEFEVMETALAASPDSAIAMLQDLRAAGFEIALDDFGTGYSSLAALRFLPIDRVKLDRSFLRDFESNNESFAVVKHTIALARDLGLKVTVEGVETEITASALSLLGVDEAQGYFYSKPLPVPEFELFTRTRNSA